MVGLLAVMQDAVETTPELKDREIRETYFKEEILPLMNDISLVMKIGQEVAAREVNTLDEALSYRKKPDDRHNDNLLGTTGGEVDTRDDLSARISLFVPAESGQFLAKHFDVHVKKNNDRAPNTDGWEAKPLVTASFSDGNREASKRVVCKDVEEIQKAFIDHMKSYHHPRRLLEINRQATAVFAEAQRLKEYVSQGYTI